MFAEVIWAIKQVLCCHSENSYEGTINLFGVIFPNGKTAANMELRRKILKYVINHGFSSYFKNILTENLGSADSLSVSFDESLNKLLKVVI